MVPGNLERDNALHDKNRGNLKEANGARQGSCRLGHAANG